MVDSERKKENERELIDRILSGKVDDYRILVENYQNLVFSMIMRCFGTRDLAEELTHECFIRAYKGLGRFQGKSAFSTWLISIALNVVRSYASSKAYRERLLSTSFDPGRHDSIDRTGESVEIERKINRIRAEIYRLKPRYRDVMILCGIESKSYEETAKILRIPYGTVCSRMNKALAILRDKLRENER